MNIILTDYRMKKEEEISNIRMQYEKSISTERTLKTQVQLFMQFNSNYYFALTEVFQFFCFYELPLNSFEIKFIFTMMYNIHC